MRLCIDLETGDALRKIPAKHDISSPIMMGRHILCYEINAPFATSGSGSGETR